MEYIVTVLTYCGGECTSPMVRNFPCSNRYERSVLKDWLKQFIDSYKMLGFRITINGTHRLELARFDTYVIIAILPTGVVDWNDRIHLDEYVRNDNEV